MITKTLGRYNLPFNLLGLLCPGAVILYGVSL